MHGSAAVGGDGAPVSRAERGRWRRVVGEHRGDEPGPLFLIVGSIHGNEPAGVRAAERVLAELSTGEIPVRGHVLALVGNARALSLGQRFVRRDLNRMWSEHDVASVRAREPELLEDEELEQRALLDAFDRVMEQRTGPVILLDLHSSSAPGEPFLCFGDTLSNRAVAKHIPVPVILGLEENIDGALLEHFSNRGHVAIAIEGGQHDDPAAVDNHEAAVWLALAAAGVVAERNVPRFAALLGRLRDAGHGLPRFVEIRHRHPTSDGDGFAMMPGFRNFQSVEKDELLARDGTGEIHAHEAGRILLPRYQGLGNDGFFLSRRVHAFWLVFSAGIRRIGLEPALVLLPGVSRHPELSESLRVDPRWARWLTVEVFHLFGYRRQRSEGLFLVFGRRRERPIE